MMMKCLRALPLAMAAEHGLDDDILLAAPGELVSIPVHACREKNNPHCQCRRVFVGLNSGNPTTLARVSLCPREEIEREVEQGSMVICSYDDDGEDGILLHDPHGIAYAIRRFDVGAIVRVDRTEEAVLLEDTWQSAVRREVRANV